MTDQYEPAPYEPPSRSRSRPSWLVPAGIVAILAIIVVAGLVLLSSDDSGDSAGGTTPTSVLVDTSVDSVPDPTEPVSSEPAPTAPPATAPPATEPPATAPNPTQPSTSASAVRPVQCPGYDDRESLPLALCDSGRLVAEAQVGLVNWGAQIDADGYFGPATEAAVREFQSAHDLEADGILGENTWAVLCPYTNNLCEPD